MSNIILQGTYHRVWLINSIHHIFFVIFVLALLAYVIARLSSKVLYVSFVMTFAITLGVSITFMVSQSPLLGVLGILFALIVVMYYNSIRPRLEFAAANLSIASKAVMKTPTVFLYTLLVLAVQVFWCLVWFVAAIGVSTNGMGSDITYGGESIKYCAQVNSAYDAYIFLPQDIHTKLVSALLMSTALLCMSMAS